MYYDLIGCIVFEPVLFIIFFNNYYMYKNSFSKKDDLEKTSWKLYFIINMSTDELTFTKFYLMRVNETKEFLIVYVLCTVRS